MQTKQRFALDQTVILRRFNGEVSAPEGTAPDHDYWRLIGQIGQVRDLDDSRLGLSAQQPRRMLVQFQVDPNSLGLHCHNRLARALWVQVEDAEPLPTWAP
ncbi:hypothetical protein [Roseateles terrae]|uniref:Uncharacterized protein n=1 Tax=Roseateles terrae TaxID=431060 RepID=A0ABR6GL43_9BURK|nr:hypothetical protein [Roseateles terrae]MBB3192821.1 hypothetical protein [Roseateles terrae]